MENNEFRILHKQDFLERQKNSYLELLLVLGNNFRHSYCNQQDLIQLINKIEKLRESRYNEETVACMDELLIKIKK